MNTELDKAAEKYARYERDDNDYIDADLKDEFIRVMQSDAAEEYRYAQWQLEQKQVSGLPKLDKPLITEQEFQDYFNAEAAEKGYQMTNTEYYLRCAWDETCKGRDELKNQVKALSAIKSGLEKSLTEAFEQLKLKQVPTDEEIEKLAEKEYPLGEYFPDFNKGLQSSFIKGFKLSLQYGVGVAELLKEKDNELQMAKSCWKEEMTDRMNKDEQIKELVNALTKLVLLKINKDTFGKDENYEKMQPKAWEQAKSILQKHNAVTKQ